MPVCSKQYIPERLHLNNRIATSQFVVGEYLYRRCDAKEVDNPYTSISITELSHNRSAIHGNTICNPDDILFNITDDVTFERYENKQICELEIITLNGNNEYSKYFEQDKKGVQIIAEMKLLHEPEPCMYPHCVFRVWFNTIVVTYDNYRQTLATTNEIRTKIKAELASMIVKKQVSQI